MAASRKESISEAKTILLQAQQHDFEHRLFPGTARKDGQHNENRGHNNVRIHQTDRKPHGSLVERQSGFPKKKITSRNRSDSTSKWKNSSAKDKQKKILQLNKILYLYDNKQSHPIIEYKPSKEEIDSSSITPSFVLEVTWPRIIQFYHPSSPHCTEFQSTYVSVARRIKHMSSRLPVEFHAVNCAKYREVCEYRFNVKSVPTVIGLKSGRIDWTELEQLSNDMNEDELVRYVADSIDVPLDEQKENALSADNIELEDQLDEKLDALDANFNPLLDEVDKASISKAIPSIPQTEHVFHDALSSFIVTLTSSVYSNLPFGSALPPDRSITLREFLDLIRWAFPPETQLHVLAQALADEFFDISTSEAKLLSIVGRHTNINDGVIWSTGCSSSENTQDGYTCGLWALLHILSIGVAERHDAVVGDVERLSVSYAGHVIRSFIDQFFNHCETCRHLWLSLYDGVCCELHNSDRSIADRSDKMTKNDDQDRRQLALWIWEVHNEITVRTKHVTGKGYNSKYSHIASSDLLWPSLRDCPLCWQSNMNNDRGRVTNMNLYNHDEIYTHLRQIYWSKGIHNNRHILLDKWTAAKRHLSMQHLRERMRSNSGLKLNALLLILCITWLAIAYYKHRAGKTTSRRKLKVHHCDDHDIVGHRSRNHMHQNNHLFSRRSKQSKSQVTRDDLRYHCKTKDSNSRSSIDSRRYYGLHHYQL